MGGMARPLKFKTPEDFDLIVDLYVATCAEEKEPLTIPGLALFLGFADKSSLYHYQKRKAFTGSVKRARTLIEESTVKRSMGSNAAGAIFMLKNMGYSDRQNVQVEPVQIVITGQDALL